MKGQGEEEGCKEVNINSNGKGKGKLLDLGKWEEGGMGSEGNGENRQKGLRGKGRKKGNGG